MKEKTQELLGLNKAELLSALRSMNLTGAVVTYSGGGDSGQMDEVSVSPENPVALRETVRLTRIDRSYLDEEKRWDERFVHASVPLRDALAEFAEIAVYAHAPGWEDGMGGAGDVTLDVESSSFIVDHKTYYEDYEASQYVG